MAKHRLHASQLQWFWHELSMLAQQGKSIEGSLELLCIDSVSQQQDPVILSIYNAYKKHNNLADALAQYGQWIDEGTLNFIRLGERYSRTPEVLAYLAQRQDSFALTRILLKNLSYPFIIIFMCMLLVLALTVFVIPVFAEMFSSMGQVLPAPTAAVLMLSDGLSDFWWLIVVGMVFLLWLLKTKAYIRFQWMLTIPILKTSLRFMAVSELLNVFAVVAQKGKQNILVDIAATLPNPVYQKQWQQQFKGHQDIVSCFRQIHFLPDAFIRVISVAEQSDRLDEMCAQLAEESADLANDALEKFSLWSRVFLMIMIGVFVGFLVIAMYLPIFQMASGL